MVKQEMARLNINILGINELKWTRMSTKESGCNLKNDRMISVHLQGKPFNNTVIQAYAPTSNAEETAVEQLCEDLKDLLELTPKKDSFSL